jgi:hypothetical protein
MNMTKEIDGEECISAGAVILMAGIAAYHGDSEGQREKGQAVGAFCAPCFRMAKTPTECGICATKPQA